MSKKKKSYKKLFFYFTRQKLKLQHFLSFCFFSFNLSGEENLLINKTFSTYFFQAASDLETETGFVLDFLTTFCLFRDVTSFIFSN
nr:MAG TPA: hypothetical protein [Caudoviricetes sp.]DAU00950.1 MAG TPA: hypothetical protein [Caudoviricetes sp.]